MDHAHASFDRNFPESPPSFNGNCCRADRRRSARVRSIRLLDRLVSAEQKSATGGYGKRRPIRWPALTCGKISGKKLTEQEKKRARAAFSVAYGLGWGPISPGFRKKFPRVSRWGGLPFAIPFFFACDGLIAPLLGVSPNLRRIPWQPSAKEMGNHIAWTAAAELVHRAALRTTPTRWTSILRRSLIV